AHLLFQAARFGAGRFQIDLRVVITHPMCCDVFVASSVDRTGDRSESWQTRSRPRLYPARLTVSGDTAVADTNLRMARELLGHMVRKPGPAPAETFVECVDRLGPMVLGVCRRILGNPADAEDAFQATFLTVFRKWESLRDRRAIAGWVHRIAVRVAGRL